MDKKLLTQGDSIQKTPVDNIIQAIINAKDYLKHNRILPAAKIINNYPPQEKELIVDRFKQMLESSDREDRILFSRLLSKMQIKDALPLYVNLLKGEDNVYYLVKAISTSLMVIQEQKQLYQNAFHQEGDVYEHSKLVCKTLIMLNAFITPSVSKELSNFPKNIENEIENILIQINSQTKQKIRTCLEEKIDGISKGKLLILCGFLHDIGKPKTATPKLTKDNRFKYFGLGTGSYIEQKFSDHEIIGADIFNREAAIIGLTEKQKKYIYELIKSHKDITDAVKNARKSRDSRLNKLKELLSEIEKNYNSLDIFYEAIFLYLADSLGKTGELSFANDIQELLEAFYAIIDIHSNR